MTLRRFDGRFGCDGVKAIDCVMAVRIYAFFLFTPPPPPPSPPPPPPIVKVVGLVHAVFVCD